MSTQITIPRFFSTFHHDVPLSIDTDTHLLHSLRTHQILPRLIRQTLQRKAGQNLHWLPQPCLTSPQLRDSASPRGQTRIDRESIYLGSHRIIALLHQFPSHQTTMSWFSILPASLSFIETWLIRLFVRSPMSIRADLRILNDV